MTHGESHDLLLDLAFGELDAARAAEVEQHVLGCDECRREKAALDEARRVTAPLRELEEPSPGFDDRIMAAAKAQAQLTHEGNIGQVIEVAGSVKPLGLTPSSIDAHGPVAVKRAEARRPRWMVRVALGGSVAAAAALALVVSTTLQNKRAAEMAQQTAAYEIKVQPVELAKKDQVARPAAAAEPQNHDFLQPSSAPPANGPPDHKEAPAQPHKAKKVAAPRDDLDQRRSAGSGGDTGNAMVPVVGASEGKLGAVEEKRAAQAPPPSAPEKQEAPPPPKTALAAKEGARNYAVAAAQPAPAAVSLSGGAARSETVAEAPSRMKMQDAQSPEALEKRAEDARHAGNYALAAGLYRRAAALQKDAANPNPASAAWDLAHAVECLAAAGQFAEARKVRDELVKLYPSEDSAFYAASRALREVDPAQPAIEKARR